MSEDYKRFQAHNVLRDRLDGIETCAGKHVMILGKSTINKEEVWHSDFCLYCDYSITYTRKEEWKSFQ